MARRSGRVSEIACFDIGHSRRQAEAFRKNSGTLSTSIFSPNIFLTLGDAVYAKPPIAMHRHGVIRELK